MSATPGPAATLARTPLTPPTEPTGRAAVIAGTDAAADGEPVTEEPPRESAPTAPPDEPAPLAGRDARREAPAAVEPVLAPGAAPGALDPAESVLSANANGIDANAEPTPNATANAPTRPT